MDDKNDNNEFDYLLKTTNKDKYVEYFWYGFKNSVLNFNENSYDIINKKSILLNKLQKEKKYNEIEEEILNFIINYGYTILKSQDANHISIFDTYIKRWNKICKSEYKIEFCDKKIINELIIFLHIYMKCSTRYKKDKHDCIMKIFDLINKISKNNKEILIQILKLSIENNFPSFIDKIKIQINVYEYIKDNYNIEFTSHISGFKMLKKMKKLNLI